MVSAAADIEQRVEVGSLSAAGQHARRAALHLRNFRCHMVIGGILKPGVEISACLQVKKLSHILAGIVFERSALNNGNLAGFPVTRRVAALYAYTVNLHIVSS